MIEVGVVEEFFLPCAAAGTTCGGVAVALGRSGGGSRALWVATCAWFLLASGGYAGSSWLTSSTIRGRRVRDRATSLAGVFLGILWMRTKNFAVLVIVHAAGDFLPNLVPWVKAFHLAR
jgi:hypothetical protein